MDPPFIRSFIASVRNVFSKMLQLDVAVGEPTPIVDLGPSDHVAGIIKFSGDLVGNFVLHFPVGTGERIVSLFTGEAITSDHDDFADAIGELVSMVAGSAKADFKGRDVSISCPSVVIGEGDHIEQPRDLPCVTIPCQSDYGEFIIEICIQDRGAESCTTAGSRNAA